MSKVYNSDAFIVPLVITLGGIVWIPIIICLCLICVPIIETEKRKLGILALIGSIIGTIIGILVGLIITINLSVYLLQEQSDYISDINIGRTLVVIVGSFIIGISAASTSFIFGILFYFLPNCCNCCGRFMDIYCNCNCCNNFRTNCTYILTGETEVKYATEI